MRTQRKFVVFRWLIPLIPGVDQRQKNKWALRISVGNFWQVAGEIIEKMKANPDGEGWMYHTVRQHFLYPDIVTESYLHSMMMAILAAAHETTSHATSNIF